MSKVEGLDFTEEQMKNASAEIVNGWRDYVGVVEDLFKQGKYGELQTEAYDVYRRCLSAIKLAEEGAKERSNASYLNDKGENVIEKRLQRLENDRLKIENNIKDLEIIADAQINHPDFDKLVKIYSKLGKNYPTALALAVKDLTQKEISTPNDLFVLDKM